MSNLEAKLDRIISLIEPKDAPLVRPCSKRLFRDMLLQTVLASVTGYFMFRILDHHFGKRTS
jgi:hypothetical protein